MENTANTKDGRTALKRVPGVGGGGDSWEFLVGVCRPVLQILTRFQTKKCNFPHPFSDQTSKIHTRFQTCPLGRNYVIITKIRAQKRKKLVNPFRIRIFLFLAFSFGIETINTFIHSVVPSKTIPDSRQNGQSVYPFSDHNGAKTLPEGTAHTYISYIREYPPGKSSLCFPHSFFFFQIQNLRIARRIWPRT